MAMKQKTTPGSVIFEIIVILVMAIVAVLSLYPFLYILFYSLSTAGQIGKGLLLWPKGLNIDAYKLMLSVDKVPHALLISVLRATIVPVCCIIITSMAAFAMTHRELRGHGFISKYLTITMYFSSGMIPTYILYTNYLHLSNSFLVYLIPGLFGVYDMILIRTYMESLPAGLQESAMIDGASNFTVWLRIVMPLCKPVLAAILLFNCVGQWNAYMDAMLYNATVTDLHPMSYVLMQFIQTSTSTVESARQKAQLSTINTTSLKMTMTIVTMVPIMCVYPFLQKHFAKGILIGSIKG